MEEEKYRVSVCRDFPNGVPLIAYAHGREDAAKLLKRLTDNDYQSTQMKTKPGCPNIVMVERWNPDENEWEFVEDDEFR